MHEPNGGGGAAREAVANESALRQALDVVYRRRDDALIVCAVVVAIVLVYTVTATPTYEARAQLLIETEAPNVVAFPEVLDPNQTTSEYYQTQYRILQSRSLARRTLDAAGLWNHPHFQPRAEAWYSPRRALRDARGWIGLALRGGSPEEPARADESAAQAQKIDAFLAGLVIAPVRNSRLVDVKYIAADPAFAATAANALVKAYVQQTLEFKFTATREASDWLTQQMAGQRKAVEAAEQALQRYREEYDSISLQERQNIVIQRLGDLNAALTRVRTERITKEASYQRLQEIRKAGGSLDAFPAVLANGFVQRLKGELASLEQKEASLADQLGDRHPEMVEVRSGIQTAQAKVQAEIEGVVLSVQNEYAAAVREEQSLQRALEAQKAEAQQLNRRAIEYGVLERDAMANRQVFDALVQRTKETGISGELRTSNIRIVDEAEVPRSPSYPNTASNVVLGLAAGIVFALGFVFVVDFLDSRIKSPAELKATLQLPFLGSIPITATDHGDLLVNNGVPAPFAEALRTVRSNVLFSSTAIEPRTVVVTSTAPGEGKTLVASNLALSLAMAGQRVLLVDADMRQPRLHELFRVPQQPGLSNVITGRTKPSEAIRKTGTERLWILPAGQLPPNPQELLGSAAFTEMLNAFGGSFDWVILDSPPVTGITDAAVVGHAASGVLFVVGAEMTTRASARAALEQLDAARVRYVGAVLNRMDPDGHPYYYYAHS